MTYTKEEIVKLLKENKCKVTFTKVDGTQRIMICSLMGDIVEPFIKTAEEHKKKLLAEGKTIKVKKENPETISVIDLDKNAWRSFNIKSIKEIVVVED